MRKAILAVGLSGLLTAGAAVAAPYGAAGCGLGSMLFGDQEGFVQIFAATTNGITANQLFGITTGTLNCEAAAAGAPSSKVFIEANREVLAKDISRGQGETIATLSALAGCKDAAAVGTALQQNFQAIFPNENVSNADVSEAVLSTLRNNADLACTQAG